MTEEATPAEEQTQNDTAGFKPPYMSFMTFWNFVGGLAAHPLPPQIDRSLMGSKSGTDQTHLVAALKAFGLIDEEHKVLPPLVRLTEASEDERKSVFAELVRRNYAGPLAVSKENGTASQLETSFRESFGLTGAETVRKSITFFLHAARMSDVQLSPHFKATRPGQGAPGQAKRRPARRKTPAPPPPAPEHEAPKAEGYGLDVELRTGGTMSLSVNVNPLSLRGEDRAFFYDIVDKMTDYAESHPSVGQAADAEPTQTQISSRAQDADASADLDGDAS
ncbi:MAG: hypothetical protein M3306_13235 [Actinomycetota bacterium]|nr:hypothetical protein [Actinomycetota bacterium]